jgi:putative alpha-1,2-mannosidase
VEPNPDPSSGIFSGWDTYHSLSQLQAMLDPAAASDQAQSLLNYYSQDKILQQWGHLRCNERGSRRLRRSLANKPTTVVV